MPSPAPLKMNAPKKLDARTWEFSWEYAVEGQEFDVYVNGVLYVTTTAHSIVYTAPLGTATALLMVQVILAGEDLPKAFHSGKLQINFERSADAAYYRIDEYEDSAWIERARIDEDGNRFHEWESREYADVTEAVVRVIAVGTNGNESTALPLTCLVIPTPAEPECTHVYDPVTGTLAITII